uniref:Reverse transcriptase domain-containing protein n=1 Tax=Labrus bergylta TaxID=56723 RepID=A0A3Q3NAX5_9LABR
SKMKPMRKYKILQFVKGTRQGCPLSPLLFALMLEPLANCIRGSKDIHGVSLGRTTHKITLYADDILLFLTSPETSVPATLSIINEFVLISGYKVNHMKSEAMPLGNFGSTSSFANFPFRWATSGFTYLGTKVSPNAADLWRLNFAPTIKNVKNDLERWHHLPPSWIGRISLILPKLLYPLQMINMKTLQLPGEQGGLAFPNLRFYNWACHTRIIWEWLQSHLNSETSMDEWYPTPFSLLSKLTNDDRKNMTSEIKANPIIRNTMRVWQDMKKYLEKDITSFALIPLTRNVDLCTNKSATLSNQK